ncbi:aldose reductase isoform X2 [Agrilus planipennis]|uniref:Aldose reductase isoform X2 n=1 Tax=Agrilus planipennis TaxID=224129 RepID=A0A1W4W9V6_AGRPL|nr:aldose reductase isoform X2 [Agrilus planipennis]
MVKLPGVVLNNGLQIPIFGLGTWKSQPGQVTQAVKDAIDIGYRHIDCAFIYGNENEVGEAISAKIEEGKVKREDLWITSKLWNTFHRPDLVEGALRKSLKNLRVDYLDLYLIHWPMAYKEGNDLVPKDSAGNVIFSDVDYVDTWKSLEKVHMKGLAKSIGVSNFNKRQIDRILENATVLPVTNQVECHPYLAQKKLGDYCKSKNIVITAYSPLGSPDRPWAKPDDPKLMDDPKLKSIAEKYKKSSPQILLRYQVERGHIVIPKSVSKQRIIENIDIFDFKLTPEDVAYINSFDCNGRICPYDEAKTHKDHPFVNDEY